jgi:hypothetical protein
MSNRMRAFVLVLFLGALVCGHQSSAQLPPSGGQIEVLGMPAEVAEVMARQVESWNRADLHGFMRGYWESDSLMFVGSKGVTMGHQATLQRYLTSYPDAQAMGVLTFNNHAWVALSESSGWLCGSWHLAKEGREDAQGMYTLLWRKIAGNWVIVADHSS